MTAPPRVFPIDQRSHVEVLVDDAQCPGEPVWTQHDDSTWWGDVTWRPGGDHSRRLDSFEAHLIREASRAAEKALPPSHEAGGSLPLRAGGVLIGQGTRPVLVGAGGQESRTLHAQASGRMKSDGHVSGPTKPPRRVTPGRFHGCRCGDLPPGRSRGFPPACFIYCMKPGQLRTIPLFS